MILQKKSFRLNRLVSTPLSRLLLRLPVTPNQVTAVSMLCGLAGGVFFACGGYPLPVAGSALYVLANVLDNCDGDIARAKNLGSAFGAWFDILGDFVTDLAMFGGIGVALLREEPGPLHAAMLALCLFGGAMHLLMVVLEKLRGFGPAQFDRPNASGRTGTAGVVFDAMREGDGCWFIPFFALIGRPEALLHLGAVYMQILWIGALAANLKHLRNPA